jgi:hypothetical protein
MSLPSSPPLNLDLRVRPTEERIVTASLVLAALAPWVLPGSFLLLSSLSLLLCLCVYAGVYNAGWLAVPHAVVRLAWLADGRWIVSECSGATAECELNPSSRVVSGAVWLKLQSAQQPDRKYTLLLTRADSNRADLRRLIVRLQLEGFRAPRSVEQSALGGR